MVSASAYSLMVTMVAFVTYVTDVFTVTTRKERVKKDGLISVDTTFLLVIK